MIRVGCCGFPGGKSKFFQEFRLAEVQETFYKLPKVETAIRWRESAPSDFEFAVKAWQAITHPTTSPTWRKAGIQVPSEKAGLYGFLKPTDEVFEAWQKTREIAEVLRAKIVLVQCPASFKCDQEGIKNAREFFGSIDRRGLEIAWEPRGNWLEKPEEVRRICDDLNLIHAVDIFWDEPVSAHPIAYIRLHGLGKRYNYRYEYTQEDLQQLLQRAKKLIEAGKREVYVLFNNVRMKDSAKLFVEVLAGAGVDFA